jgi:hypothetical protein
MLSLALRLAADLCEGSQSVPRYGDPQLARISLRVLSLESFILERPASRVRGNYKQAMEER